MTRTATMTRVKKGKTARGSTKAKALIVGLLAAGMMAAGLVAAPPARAADAFTVERTIDTPDANIGDGDCDVSLAATGLQCTLRAAIEEANATPEADLIRFAIPGTGVQTVDVGSLGFGPLPLITKPVTVDGYTQPGAKPNTKTVGNDAVLKIELNGAGAGSANGLEIKTSSGSVIRGLAINRFGGDGDGIAVTGDSVANRIEGNFIGTDPTGTLDRGNGQDAVSLSGGPSETVVGGTTPSSRNLLSGNGDFGVFVQESNVNRVEGNYIGTDKDGTKDLGNNTSGVFMNFGFDNTIGGATTASRNVISGNGFEGIDVFGGSGNKVIGNRIGTTASGTGPLPNNSMGVFLSQSSNNLIGDGTPGGSNTVAFNGDDGVGISGSSSTGNKIFRNAIFSNGAIGIDLSGGAENAAGATTNDLGDADVGPNTLQNKPVLSSAKTVSGKTTIQGILSSTPNRGFLVEFYSNPSGGEGKKFVGDKVVSTNSSGNAPFSFVPSQAVGAGQTVTATASGDRNGPGGTSEFSAPKKVAAS